MCAVPLSRNRNFILLLLAYAISAFGDHLSELGIMRVMGVESGDDKTRISALMMFCFFLPYVIFGPLAGVTADRLPRRLIMITTDLLRGLIALSIPWYFRVLDDPHSTLMILPMLGLGLFASFFNPARLSFVPQVVGDRHLTQANSLLNGLAPIAAIASFVVAGQLVSDRGPGAPDLTRLAFYGDAATFALSALLVACIALPAATRAAPPDQHRVSRSPLADIATGLRYVRSHRCVWQLMIFTFTFWTAAGAFSSVLPPVVFDWYGYGAEHYDVLGYFKATLGVGMLLGAVVMTGVADASRPHYNIIVASLGVGAAILLFAATSDPWVGGPLAVGVGFFGVWIFITANTTLQRIVPDRHRGKVFGIVDLVNMSGMLLATGILGILHIPRLDEFIDWILRGLGLGLLVLGLLVWRHHARRSPVPWVVGWCRALNEVVCKAWYRLRRHAVCTVPPAGPCIITANHLCGADPCFLIASSPRRVFGFMIAREFYNLPIFKYLIHGLKCIPVRRDGKDIAATKEALRHLRAGQALCIFIEGRITGPGNEPQLRDGVAALALRSGAPVIPAHISGVKYDASLLKTFFRRHQVRTKFGPPVDLGDINDPKNREHLSQATTRIWQSIQNLAPKDEPVYI